MVIFHYMPIYLYYFPLILHCCDYFPLFIQNTLIIRDTLLRILTKNRLSRMAKRGVLWGCSGNNRFTTGK
jgi:hypothetical protein